MFQLRRAVSVTKDTQEKNTHEIITYFQKTYIQHMYRIQLGTFIIESNRGEQTYTPDK